MKPQKLFEYHVRVEGNFGVIASSGVKWTTDKPQLKKDVLNNAPWKGLEFKADQLEWSILEIDVAQQLGLIVRAAREAVKTGLALELGDSKYPVESKHHRALEALAKLV